MKTTLLISFIATLTLLSGCGAPEKADIHDQPAPAYTTVDVSAMELEGLTAHLKTLKTEIERSTQTQAFGEMHYQEVALTATLNALSPLLPENSKTQTETLIAEIKPIAIKLHIAGHDQTATIAKKIGEKLSSQIDQLLGLLP